MTAIRRAWEWLTVRDYERAKQKNAENVVKRLTRGNIPGQNGWSMTKDALDKKSRDSDRATKSLRHSLKAMS